MAMMISKFHRLIQSKLLWGIFSVVISISFVGLFTEIPMLRRAQQKAANVGSVDGEPVDYKVFQNAYSNTRIQMALAYGQDLPRTDAVENTLREMAWKRLVSLRRAHELQLKVSDNEVLSGIQRQSIFHTEGRFDPRIYSVFLNRFLMQQLGINQFQFESYMREELLLRKFEGLIEDSILVSPLELTRAYRAVTDTFTIDTIAADMDSIPLIEADDEQSRAFYDQNPEAFREPERVVVDIVSFPVSTYQEELEVTEEDAFNYYTENIETYRIPEETADIDLDPMMDSEEETEMFDLSLETNEVPEEESLPSALADTAPPLDEPQYKSFESVQDEVKEALRLEMAQMAAAEAATDFVLAVQDGAYSDRSFQAVASEAGYTVSRTQPFALGEAMEGLPEGADLSREAFDLGDTPETSFSDALDADDRSVVLSLVERQESYIPEFDNPDVQTLAKLYASQEATSAALVEKMETLRKEAEEALKDGEDFTTWMEAQGYEVRVYSEVTAAEGIPDSPYEEILVRGILTRNQGEISDLLPAQDSILLAYIRERTPAPPQSFAEYRGRIVQNLVGERAPRIFRGFQDQLLLDSDFKEAIRSNDTEDSQGS